MPKQYKIKMGDTFAFVKPNCSKQTKVYEPKIGDAYNKFANERDKEYLKDAIAEMKRYVNRWSSMSTKQKRDISPLGLSDLKQQLKYAEDRLKQLRDTAIKDYRSDKDSYKLMEDIPLKARTEMKKPGAQPKAIILGYVGQMEDIIKSADPKIKSDLKQKALKILSDLDKQFKTGVTTLKDKCIKDAKKEYTINWQDTYHRTKDKTRVDANSVWEAVRKFGDIIALGGIGTANCYIVNISPNDGWMRTYGKLSDLLKQHKNDTSIKDAKQYTFKNLAELKSILAKHNKLDISTQSKSGIEYDLKNNNSVSIKWNSDIGHSGVVTIKDEALKVKVYTINRGQPSQYYGLKLAEKGNEQILPYAPNNWKTEKGALDYAKKKGYIVVNDENINDAYIKKQVGVRGFTGTTYAVFENPNKLLKIFENKQDAEKYVQNLNNKAVKDENIRPVKGPAGVKGWKIKANGKTFIIQNYAAVGNKDKYEIVELETKKRLMENASASQVKQYAKENWDAKLLDKLIDIPQQYITEFTKELSKMGLKVTGSGKTPSGRYHLQVITTQGKMDNGHLMTLGNKLDALTRKFKNQYNIPGTFNMGLQKDGYISAGIDLDQQSVKDSNTIKDKLIQSSSKEAFDKNVATEIRSGKSKEQALAIAYDIQRKNKDNSVVVKDDYSITKSEYYSRAEMLNRQLLGNYISIKPSKDSTTVEYLIVTGPGAYTLERVDRIINELQKAKNVIKQDDYRGRRISK